MVRRAGLALVGVVVILAACSGGTLEESAGHASGLASINQLRTKLTTAGFTCGRSTPPNQGSRTISCVNGPKRAVELSWTGQFRARDLFPHPPKRPGATCSGGLVVIGDHWWAATSDKGLQTQVRAALGGESRELAC